MALCNYCETSDDLLPLRAAFALLSRALEWTVNPNVNVERLLSRLTESIIKGSRRLEVSLQDKIFTSIMSKMVDWTKLLDITSSVLDPISIKKRIHSCLRGIRLRAPFLTAQEGLILINKSCEFLDGTAFDIRLLLADTPTDFRLEDVVRSHFAPTMELLSTLTDLKPPEKVDDVSIAKFFSLIDDHLEILQAFIIDTPSSEPFLCLMIEKLIVRPSLFSLCCSTNGTLLLEFKNPIRIIGSTI